MVGVPGRSKGCHTCVSPQITDTDAGVARMTASLRASRDALYHSHSMIRTPVGV